MKLPLLLLVSLLPALATAAGFQPETATANPAAASGQPRATSTHYTQDSALTADASGVATSTHYTNRSGYVGQLYDVTALTLAATTTTVDERTTTQLAAGASLDDGTLLVPQTSDVQWAVVSGPIAAVAVDGTATAGSTYQTTTATVSGQYSGTSATLVITVLNVTADDFGPYAGDGLPDDWQVSQFGEGNSSAGPTIDPDGDGQNNLLEYLAGTNPNSGASAFTVRLELVVGQPDRKAIVFGPVASGRTYRVLSNTSLSTTGWADLSGALAGTTGHLTFTDTAATGARKFYRIQISNP